MIIDLPGTTTAAINRKLVDLREGGGTIALGRVLTLVIVTDEHDAEEAIDAANSASREHPCRVIVVVQGTGAAPTGWTPRSGSAATPAPARSSCCGCTASSPSTATAS